ncbi:MAG TPA: helix-turn-helix domain-containing protein [Propionibacteriaceae bacterium]|jgi:AcrR family transcriptional regulator|nr:helix-turn-helix domain-containing protein [Propionibacteriaceae bacterium]
MSQPRRSPRAQDRKRDPERTRERILDAAVVEFGEHGFAGARISAIARRAGVNEQLISYYFDSKEGLYGALQQRWQLISAGASRPELPIAEVVAAFLRLSIEQRSFARLLAWDGLAHTGSDAVEPDEYFTEMVEELRRRQQAGELADDLDPAYVLLILFAAALAPTVIPQIARRLTGLSADSRTFQAAYAEQLRHVVERLAD